VAGVKTGPADKVIAADGRVALLASSRTELNRYEALICISWTGKQSVKSLLAGCPLV
jgi:hypothetical protein